MKVTIELEELAPGSFSLIGRADVTNVGRLLADGRVRFICLDEVTVNLEQADCSNTAGLALLMEWSTWCSLYGISLIYEKPPGDLLDIVRINDAEQVLSFSR